MTPQDFLESVVEQEPRRECRSLKYFIIFGTIFMQCYLLQFTARLKRRTLTDKDLAVMRDTTPPLKKGSTQMFRSLRDKGETIFEFQ